MKIALAKNFVDLQGNQTEYCSPSRFALQLDNFGVAKIFTMFNG